NLINDIPDDEPDPKAANALQEGVGGQYGEMRTMMQYLFQSFNFRGDAKPFRDLIHAVAVEEISHLELIATTVSRLLDGSPRYQGKTGDVAAEGGTTPMEVALQGGNAHHWIVGAQSSLPVDAAGNPWSGSYVHNSGNLTLDLLNNLMLECTGRLQKCRIYEMTDNKTARATISYLIVRDHGHELVFAKALETLGVDWAKTLPIPNFDATKYPEVKALMDQGLHLRQHHFRLDDSSEMAKIFKGSSPENNGSEVQTQEEAPEGAANKLAPERVEEFSPGLTPELKKFVEEQFQI
ncbi:manganese catalase family protein, partial [bacterium]